MSRKKAGIVGVFPISRSVWVLSAACMFVSVSVAITMSVAPMFLRELGVSMVVIGLLDGMSEGIAQVSRLVAGVIVDYIGRKKVALLIGVFVSVISKPFLVLANAGWMVAFSKFLERISNGVIAIPRDSYVIEAVTPGTKGSALGLMMTLKTFGISLGSIFAAVMLYYKFTHEAALWVGLGFVLLGFLLIKQYVPEQKRRERKERKASLTFIGKLKKIWLKMKNLDIRYWSIVLVACVFYSARVPEAFMMFRYKEVGGSEYMLASLIGIFNFISFLTCYPLGYLSDKFGRTALLVISFLSLLVAHLCFVIASSTSVMMIGVCLWGVQRGTSQVLFTSIIADAVPSGVLGTALGVFYIIMSVINTATGYIAGKLASDSLGSVFYYCSIVAVVAVCMLLIRFFIISITKKKVSGL